MAEESFRDFGQAYSDAHDASLLHRIFIATVAIAHRVHDEPFDFPNHALREVLADKILQTGQDFSTLFANMICSAHAITPSSNDAELIDLVARHWNHVAGVQETPPPPPPVVVAPPAAPSAAQFLASQNAEFQHRVFIFTLLEANDVFNEAATVTGHVARLALANGILQGTNITASQNFVNLLAAEGLSDNSTDIQLRQAIQDAWNAIAAASPTTPVPTAAVGYAPVSATVATAESSGSTTYVDLATVGPTITLTVSGSGMVELRLAAKISLNTDDNQGFMGFALSGANVVAATDVRCLEVAQGRDTAPFQVGVTYVLSSLAAGVTTFTAKYRSSGVTATFSNRSIIGIPL